MGTITPKEKLSVRGKIRAEEIKVEATNWPDYVFDANHQFLSLLELESYIKFHRHLPEIPSGKKRYSFGGDAQTTAEEGRGADLIPD